MQKEASRQGSLSFIILYQTVMLISPHKLVCIILRILFISPVCPMTHISFVTAASLVMSRAEITPFSDKPWLIS